jgi:tellurite resistance protein
MIALTRSETESILALCLMASFADGEKHEREREQIRKITDSLAGDDLDVAALYQEVLLNRPSTSTFAARLERPEARQLAYEMAVCVCDADEVRNESEKAFLKQLSDALALPSSATLTADTASTSLTTISVGSATPSQSEETDAMILRYAIVGGALELLPQTMATLAIVPLQTKMVYRLSKQRGFELDQKSIAEFMATVALPVASAGGSARKSAGNSAAKSETRSVA